MPTPDSSPSLWPRTDAQTKEERERQAKIGELIRQIPEYSPDLFEKYRQPQQSNE